MSAEILMFNGVTKLDMPPALVIETALKAGMTSVTIVGELEDGSEYFASSHAGGPEVLWALERAKLKLLQTVGD